MGAACFLASIIITAFELVGRPPVNLSQSLIKVVGIAVGAKLDQMNVSVFIMD